MKTFDTLRKDFPYFIYEGFEIIEEEDLFVIIFNFNNSEKIFFNPKLKVPKKHIKNALNSNDTSLRLLLFNIGMIELISYWKATCSPKIIIKAGQLDSWQIDWWKKLYFHGLGEFLYLNNIEISIDDLLDIEVDANAEKFEKTKFNTLGNLVPIGGGKDSIVSLHLLRKLKADNSPFIINPRGATIDSALTAGYNDDEVITVNRLLDKKIIELNAEGYLNGHTPFSAMLAFVTLFVSALTGKKNIILSNEESANESTVEGTMINHQYSKSYEFEKDFNEYVSKYITDDIKYFSLLRPLNEFKITKIFSGLKDFYKVFKSCNVGSKENKWCGHCAKCLFVYIMLSPNIDKETLVKIFGHDLLDDLTLQKEFEELTGIHPVKPFECVGTKEEVNASLTLYANKNSNKPKLIEFWEKYPELKLSEKDLNDLESYFNTKHFIPREILNKVVFN